MTTKANTKTALVVTTAKKGVFFGYGTDTGKDTITLTNVRMCVYWPTENRGVLGLASTGPVRGARITAAVPKMCIREVTATMDCTEEAIAAWEKGPWS